MVRARRRPPSWRFSGVSGTPPPHGRLTARTLALSRWAVSWASAGSKRAGCFRQGRGKYSTTVKAARSLTCLAVNLRGCLLARSTIWRAWVTVLSTKLAVPVADPVRKKMVRPAQRRAEVGGQFAQVRRQAGIARC